MTYYKENSARLKAGVQARRRAQRDRIRELKRSPCTDCGGVFPPVCMDFDHVDGGSKVADVSEMTFLKWGRILEEIAKCDLVCSNCHRIRTDERRAKK